MAMFNYENEALYQQVKGEALPSSPVYVAECKKEIIDEVSPNYPQLVEYEKEWLHFSEYVYHDGTPVPLEYQDVNTYDYASVENAIPFNYKSAILKGKTLVNVAKQEKPFYHSADKVSQNNNVQLSHSLKANTTYTRFIHVSALDLGTTWEVGMYDALIGEDGSYSQYSYKITSKGWLINTFTTKTTSITPYMINPDMGALSNGLIYMEIDKFMIIEGDYTNVDMPYFKGMKSVKMPVITTTNEDGTKINILTCDEDVTLRSNGNICDELNLLTGQLTQRIGEDGEVLSQEVVKTVDLNQTIKPYEGTNHYQVSSDTITPQLLLSVPVVSTGAKTLNDIIMEE